MAVSIDYAKVELQSGQEDHVKAIEVQLKDQLRLKTNLGYRIEFYDYGRLPRYEVKARRFKDLRKQQKQDAALGSTKVLLSSPTVVTLTDFYSTVRQGLFDRYPQLLNGVGLL